MNTQLHTSLPWLTLVQMTRPGFLVITAVACVLGTAVAAACGHGPHVWSALATLVLAVLMHAAADDAVLRVVGIRGQLVRVVSVRSVVRWSVVVARSKYVAVAISGTSSTTTTAPTTTTTDTTVPPG